ncbi:pentapeptide repeat-containing protein [Intestinicryptomonas porci]|uniref:Pentapeptide repeat-containing protein n=1 Tax=Intestinicryptomonas porci TaxID=2926320 RepID=A0ABU4WFU4_9BACT|nr:pentapeptide repeat-containing protein [Opitutales bacterium CLA-KB-P66]
MRKYLFTVVLVFFSLNSFADYESYTNQNVSGQDFSGRSLVRSLWRDATAVETNFSNSDLTNADFESATLTNADFTDAVITGAYFYNTTSKGFTKEQLYSTASYKNKDLSDVGLGYNDLTGWNFAGQTLTNADLSGATLTNANLGFATLTNANLGFATLTNADLSGATLTNVYFESATLTNADLSGATLTNVYFESATLTNADLSGATLTNVYFYFATLTNADFTDAVITGANFGNTTSEGFTKEQLYRTASYKNKDLSGVDLFSNNLTGWNFAGQNLTNASFYSATLTNADFTDAVITGADFYNTTSKGFTKEQLYRTASYKNKDLSGVDLGYNDLTGWNFTDVIITGANFGNTTSKGFTKEQLYSTASYKNKDLSGVGLGYNDLTGWNFTDVIITGACFRNTTSKGFTKEQLYSTASYKNKDLSGVDLSGNDLTGWDFSSQTLTNANFYSATLTNADLSGATLTNANLGFATLTNADLSGATLTNANLGSATLTNADLSGATLTNANLGFATLTNADLSGATLTNANLGFATLTNADLSGATLTNAYFADVIITGADFGSTTSKGFTKEQLYRTASYKNKDLSGVGLSGNDLTGWDFSSQNLTNADFSGARFIGKTSFGNSVSRTSDLSGANFTNADFSGVSGYIYLKGVNTNFTGADFTGTRLYGVSNSSDFNFENANFTNVKDYASANLLFYHANIKGANFTQNITSSLGADYSTFTSALYVTKSYLEHDLSGINFTNCFTYNYGFERVNLNFQNQNLTGANLTNVGRDVQWIKNPQPYDIFMQNIVSCDFRGANLTDAIINGASIAYITSEQLYSTASYKNKNLSGVWFYSLYSNSMSSENVDLTGQNLTKAFLDVSLANFDLTDSIINEVSFGRNSALSKEQLYSTKSYKDKNLQGIGLFFREIDLSGFDFSCQDLTNACFCLAGASPNLLDADFTDAIITNVIFSSYSDPGLFSDSSGFTKEQLYSTKNYKENNLGGIKLVGKIYGWDFRGKDISQMDISNRRNIISTDGTILDFAMASSDDSFSIRKYVSQVATMALDGDSTISAKIDKTASISNSTLTLESDAELEVVENATLVLADGGKIVFEASEGEKSILQIAEGSAFNFADGASIEILLTEDFKTPQTFAVMNWTDVSKITGLENLVKGENIFVESDVAHIWGWSFSVESDGLYISVPEPATYAAIFGALALAFAAYRRRK